MIPGEGVSVVRCGRGITQTYGEGYSPVAASDAFTVTRGSSIVSLTVMSNDSFAPDFEEVLRVVSVGATSAGGVVTIALGGASLTYTPAVGFTGSETFSYVLGDGSSAPTVTSLVTITVTR